MALEEELQLRMCRPHRADRLLTHAPGRGGGRKCIS